MSIKSRTLKVFLVDGAPNGLLTAEIMNWTGHVITGPRTKLAELIQRPEVKRTAVYFLVGPDQGTGMGTQVYIGETDDAARRLALHAFAVHIADAGRQCGGGLQRAFAGPVPVADVKGHAERHTVRLGAGKEILQRGHCAGLRRLVVLDQQLDAAVPQQILQQRQYRLGMHLRAG